MGYHYTLLYSVLLCSPLLYWLYFTYLFCTVLSCTVVDCTVLWCTLLYCTVLYCTVLYCTVLYCTVLYCTVLYSSVPYCSAFPNRLSIIGPGQDTSSSLFIIFISVPMMCIRSSISSPLLMSNFFINFLQKIEHFITSLIFDIISSQFYSHFSIFWVL